MLSSPKTLGHHRTGIGGIAVLVIAALLLVLTFVSGGEAMTPSSQVPSALTTSRGARVTALSAPENALLAYVPNALGMTCRSITASISQDFAGVKAALGACGLGNAKADFITARYVQFSDAASMNTAYQTYIRNQSVAQNTGRGDACPQERAYKVGGNVGRAACSLLSGSTPQVISTTKSSKILLYVEGLGTTSTASQVWQYWQSSAQPLKKPRHLK